MAIKQFLVGLILTTDLNGHPKNSSPVKGISNSRGYFVLSEIASIFLTKFENLEFSFFFCYLSLSSCSNSSMSLSFFLPALISMSSATVPDSLKNCTSYTFLVPTRIGFFKWKWIITISSSSAQGWKKQCLTLAKVISIEWPLVETNLTPFWWTSKFPVVFLPTILGLITKFSRTSFFPLIYIRSSYTSSGASYLISSSVSWTLTFLIKSLICLKAETKWLEPPLLGHLRVNSLTKRAFYFSIWGNCNDETPGIWKFNLRYVNYPSGVVDTFLIVAIWKGTNPLFTGIRIVSWFLSIYNYPGLISFGICLSVV